MKSLIISLLMVLSICICLPVQGNIYYMSTNGSSIPPYDSLQNAATNYNDVHRYIIDTIYSNGVESDDICFFDSGIYYITNQINNEPFITFQSINGAEETVINGSKIVTDTIIRNNGTVDGFTICGGKNSTGGSTVINDGTIKNCIFINNTNIDAIIYNNQGTVQNCLFWNNNGAIRNIEGDFLNCTIVSNSNDILDPVWSDKVVLNSGLFENCITINNMLTCNSDGGIVRYTIATTNLRNYDGTVENVIVTNNAGFENSQTFRQVKLGNDLVSIPSFRLSSNSVCINRGYLRSSMTNENDVYLNPRVMNNAIDIGAAEFGNSDSLNQTFTIKATKNKDSDKIAITWPKIHGKSHYYIWRNTNDCFETAQFMTDVRNNHWTDNRTRCRVSYYYWIIAKSDTLCNGLISDDIYSQSTIGSTYLPLGPRVKVNDYHTSQTFERGSLIDITVQLGAESNQSETYDYWVVAATSFGCYYLNSQLQWIEFQNLGQVTPAAQGNAIEILPYTILRTSGLPVGSYNVYFGLDRLNGVIDINDLIVDHMSFTVQ